MEEEHVISNGVNVVVLGVLVALALATWGISYADLGHWNLVVAMIIAVIKMLLVVLVFMHGWFSPRVTKLAFCAGLFWLGILVVLTLGDYLSRSLLSYGGQ
jgi:cytochrome c oxidase subunit 4